MNKLKNSKTLYGQTTVRSFSFFTYSAHLKCSISDNHELSVIENPQVSKRKNYYKWEQNKKIILGSTV